MSTILAIDDNQDNLLVLKALLKNYMVDIVLITSQSGKDGIKKAKTNRPDTIILDVKMPEMDGYEVCRHLKASKETKDIPVIMLTAESTNAKNRAHGLNVGADAFLTKPIEGNELVAQIQAMLRIKNAEDLLRQEKRSLERLVDERGKKAQQYLDIAGVMFVAFDLTGKITLINQHGCKILEVKENDALGKNWFDTFIATHQAEELRTVCNELIAGTIERIRYHEYPVLTAEGNERIVAFHNTVVTRENDLITGILFSGEDITKRKTAEGEKKKLELQLKQAQKMEAIGTLAGGIAHDFNNILGAILGYADLAQDSLPPESDAQQDLEQVMAAGYRARDLVKQILAFSHRSNDQLMLLQPSAIVEESLQLLRSTIPTTIEIDHDINSKGGAILGDPTQLHQVIMNLCTNAYHAMEQQGGVLGVTLENVELAEDGVNKAWSISSGHFVKLTISDTGSGIHPNIRDRIFDPYFTTKEHGKGTGMGLAMVHGIVENHRGFIELESSKDKGTTFKIFFPVAGAELSEFDNSPGTLPKGKENILFVDDEESLVKVGKNMLERLGYRVTAKRSSIEALEMFRAQPQLFDLIITDQTMPGMTGADLARAVMTIRPDIPVILCTGYSNLISENKAKTIGIREYVMKPIVLKDFAILVRRVLNTQADL